MFKTRCKGSGSLNRLRIDCLNLEIEGTKLLPTRLEPADSDNLSNFIQMTVFFVFFESHCILIVIFKFVTAKYNKEHRLGKC